jgi:hypothetical protein
VKHKQRNDKMLNLLKLLNHLLCGRINDAHVILNEGLWARIMLDLCGFGSTPTQDYGVS